MRRPSFWALLAVLLFSTSAFAAQPKTLTLWHSYRGAEEEALEKAVGLFTQKTGIKVDLLALPNDAYATKLQSAIPHHNGPDVFIFPSHEKLRLFHENDMIAVSDPFIDKGAYIPSALKALTLDGHVYGYPLSLKCLALFLNTRLVTTPPRTTDELVHELTRLGHPDQNKFGMAFQAGEPYFFMPFLFGYGGDLFDAHGKAQFDTPQMAKALAFVRSLQDQRLIPQETSGALVKTLFNDGDAAMVIDGPWFAGEISPDIDYKVVPLPKVSATGKPLEPFLGVEVAFVSSQSQDPQDAQKLARFISVGEAALVRATVGRQVPANVAAYDDPRIQHDRLIAAFREAASNAIPMPATLEMSRVWEPMKLALRGVMQGGVEPKDGGALATRRYRALNRPAPPAASETPYWILLGLAVVGWGVWQYRKWVKESDGRPLRKRYPDLSTALAYIAPTAAGVLVLIAIPFSFGIALAFFHHDGGDHYTFVGLANFTDILASHGYKITEPLSFYFTLAVTVLWAAVNVFFHVSLGLSLALLLKDPLLKLRGVYRVLLIVPWAVPNYITALMWKGMFHRQFGAINGILVALGIQPISWFTHWSTSFAADVATNTWLGFPFMMVVALGALQSIPQDLYEAAEVDGASKWAQFKNITLPLLRPALLPSIILGTIWTFNMFNVIYLVSGGEPGGSTDILVSDAFRWAFERNEQYGYAAAYSVLIFFVLWAYSAFTKRLTAGAEEVLG